MSSLPAASCRRTGLSLPPPWPVPQRLPSNSPFSHFCPVLGLIVAPSLGHSSRVGIYLQWRGEGEGRLRDQVGRTGVQDGLLGLGPATSIPGHVPYYFSSLSPAVAVVTSLPPSSSPSMAPTPLLGFPLPCNSPHLPPLPSPYYLGVGGSRPVGGEPICSP